MKNEQSRMLSAFILSGLILFGWQYFFAPKKTKLPQPSLSHSETKTNSQQAIKSDHFEAKKESITPTETKDLIIAGVNTTYTITNDLIIKEVVKNNVSAQKDIFESKKLSSIEFLVGEKVKGLTFNTEESTKRSITGYNEEAAIRFNASVDEKDQLKLHFTKDQKSPVSSLVLSFSSKPGQVDSYQIKSFSYAGKDSEKISIGEDEQESVTINWLGMDYKYYLLAMTFPEKKHLSVKTSSVTNKMETYIPFGNENELSMNTVFVKKEYDDLVAMGNNLHLSVDFGFFSFIAIPILRGLQFFYSLIANYGIAIILLTLVIRLITFPLQYKSTKSMKKMQVIQPELKKIQEKYKGEPQKLQKESMELFKKAGANPFSGCFPLLLQMPIFFAFYKVLYNSVELVDAPFYFWIHDLSSKDPFYVLPVLMTGAMFLQQKLTPTATTDATQKKVMLFMPIVFGFIMKDLPSGLNLYIFVSTLIAIVFQMLVLKNIKV